MVPNLQYAAQMNYCLERKVLGRVGPEGLGHTLSLAYLGNMRMTACWDAGSGSWNQLNP